MELEIGVYGSGDGSIEVMTSRGGAANRNIGTFAANTTEDVILTVVGPCDVNMGIPSGGTFVSGPILFEVVGRQVPAGA